MLSISGLSSVALQSLEQGVARYDAAQAGLVRSITPAEEQSGTAPPFDSAVSEMRQAEVQLDIGVTMARKAQEMTGSLLDLLA